MTTQHITLNQTLTPHFTLAEFVRSGVAIRHNIANTPTPNAINNLRLLCENVLEPLRRQTQFATPAGTSCRHSPF